MPTHGKKYRGKVEGVDLSQRFSVEDAVISRRFLRQIR